MRRAGAGAPAVGPGSNPALASSRAAGRFKVDSAVRGSPASATQSPLPVNGAVENSRT